MVGGKKEKIYMENTQEKYDFLQTQLFKIESNRQECKKKMLGQLKREGKRNKSQKLFIWRRNYLNR